MSRNYRMSVGVRYDDRSRWVVGASLDADSPLRPTPGARVHDLRGSFANGQALAGSGALVFEGELLEGLRLN